MNHLFSSCMNLSTETECFLCTLGLKSCTDEHAFIIYIERQYSPLMCTCDVFVHVFSIGKTIKMNKLL